MKAHLPFLLLLAFQLSGLCMAIAVERKRFHMLALAKERDAHAKISSVVIIFLLSVIGCVVGIVVGAFFYIIVPPTFSTLTIAEGLKVGMIFGFVGLFSFCMSGFAIERLWKNSLWPE